MYELSHSNRFKKDLKRLKKRSNQNFDTLQTFVEHLVNNGFNGVSQKNKPHYLIGNYSDHCECHVLNDLLLIWLQDDIAMTIKLVRTGTHSDLF